MGRLPLADSAAGATALVGAAIIGQSGGPTVVINQSLVGYVIEALKHKDAITRVLGMRHGLKVCIVSTSPAPQRSPALALLPPPPSFVRPSVWPAVRAR